MVDKLGVAADSADYFQVKEIEELLRKKGVKARGRKAQTCKQVALACTAEEFASVASFRTQKEMKALTAALAEAGVREAGQRGTPQRCR